MGLDLTTGWWSCWRNKLNHSGKSPLRLIMKMINVPYWKARQIAGLDDTYVDPEGFDAAVARIMGRDTSIIRPDQVRKDFLSIPKDFDLITDRGRSARHFRYLAETRGFGEHTIDLIEEYLLLYSKGGSFADRIILPYLTNGELVSWTGRAITATATLRFKDLPLDDCLIPPKENLYNHDAVIQGGKVLVVVEGQFDTLKVDLFGRRFGVRAVGLSTNTMTDEQVYLVEEASSNFDRTVVMMDNASVLGVVDSMRLKQRISHIKNASIISVPFGCKDSGEFTPSQAVAFTKDLGQGHGQVH